MRGFIQDHQFLVRLPETGSMRFDVVSLMLNHNLIWQLLIVRMNQFLFESSVLYKHKDILDAPLWSDDQ